MQLRLLSIRNRRVLEAGRLGCPPECFSYAALFLLSRNRFSKKNPGAKRSSGIPCGGGEDITSCRASNALICREQHPWASASSHMYNTTTEPAVPAED